MVRYSGTISITNAVSFPNAISVHDALADADYGANAISVHDAACSSANALFGAAALPFGVGLWLVHRPIGLHTIPCQLRQLLLL